MLSLTGYDRFSGYEAGYDRTFGTGGGFMYPQREPVSLTPNILTELLL